MIVNDKATYFLFGSQSQFDDLCHGIVSELQQKYPSIVRVAYTCRSEAATMKEDKEREEEIWRTLLHKEVRIKDFDAEYEHPAKYSSGRGSYVERNQAMIDDSIELPTLEDDEMSRAWDIRFLDENDNEIKSIERGYWPIDKLEKIVSIIDEFLNNDVATEWLHNIIEA